MFGCVFVMRMATPQPLCTNFGAARADLRALDDVREEFDRAANHMEAAAQRMAVDAHRLLDAQLGALQTLPERGRGRPRRPLRIQARAGVQGASASPGSLASAGLDRSATACAVPSHLRNSPSWNARAFGASWGCSCRMATCCRRG